MARFEAIVGAELAWVKAGRRQFSLHLGGDVLATLTWRERGRALGEWGVERFWFSHEGWFRPRTVVRRTAESAGAHDVMDTPIALFVHAGGGGSLVSPAGKLIVWKSPRFWAGERVWIDDTTVLVRVWPARGNAPTTVSVQPEAANRSEIPLLILLGQYLCVRAAREEEAAIVAATTVISAGS
jgi:hypothetical protein